MARWRHLLFLPDFDRRLWLRTRSADPFTGRALAGCPENRDTAGGDFHPALRLASVYLAEHAARNGK
jgi:hypothetical protein